MKTFRQYLNETRGRGGKGDKTKNYGPSLRGPNTTYADWEADAKKLGYHITHHEGAHIPGRPDLHARFSVAHKIERDDPKQGYENHPHGPPLNRSRGTFWHVGYGQPHGFLRYKYMPTNEAVINTAQDKAQRQAFHGLEKKIIKPTIPKSTDLQKKLIKPMQSNIANMIDAIASHPAGIPSGIPGGQIG